MTTKRCWTSAVAIGFMFSTAVFGQSMIEYGHGVAKAGAAGAASGTGLAGIFSKLKDTSEDKDKDRQYTTAKPPAGASETAENGQWRQPSEPANAPLRMTTSSGVVVSGVSPSWMVTSYSDAVGAVRVNRVEWANPAEEQAVVAEAATEGPAHGLAEPPASPSTTGSAPVAASQPGEIVSPGHAVGNTYGQGPLQPLDDANAPRLELATDGAIAGVRIGTKIDDVIRTLGRPTFSLTGIVGRNYTEKYVFKKAGGESITVLTWTGIVTSVSVI
jgi:hypothetical protein